MFKPALLWRLVRATRRYARPLWQIKVGSVPLWRRVGDWVYRLPCIPNHVEGAELSCLQGMQGIIQQSPDIQVAIEMNLVVLEQLGMSPQEYFDQLSQLGGHRVWVIEYHEEISTPQHLSNLLEKMRSQYRKVVNLLVGFSH